MPTTSDRLPFVQQSIKYFLRQDYPNKELVVVEDGSEAMTGLVPDDPQVRYVHLPGTRTLGAKRNRCVETARGDLIMHWDDDDWMAPHRIRYQVEALLRKRAQVCGLRRMLFYNPVSSEVWLYAFPEDHQLWLAGGSLLYTREFWRRAPFPDIQVASDTRFIWAQDLSHSVTLHDPNFYLAIIHPHNTSPKNCHGSYWSSWPGNVRDILGVDYSFYEELVMRLGPTTPPARKQDENPDASLTPRCEEIEPARTYHSKSASAGMAREVIAAVDRNSKPKVSCILATGNRPAFTRQAVRCFLRQTLADSELIVVDDGEPSVAELCSGLFRVRYVRLDEPTSLGRKLNIGIEHSTGEIIQKLDDDDFYGQDFLARSVIALDSANDERAVITWDCFTILIAGERIVRDSGHGWTTGGTLCFHRALWRQHQFRNVPQNVDTWFIEDHVPRLVRVCAPELYMLVRHGCNTWNQLSSGTQVDDYFKSLPRSERTLDEVIEPIDQSFYFSLSNGRAQ
jgi:glycosyltransferase involved in cell wall biosynthesis